MRTTQTHMVKNVFSTEGQAEALAYPGAKDAGDRSHQQCYQKRDRDVCTLGGKRKRSALGS